MSERVERRDFLRMGLEVVAAVALESVSVPAKKKIEEVVTEVTGRSTGNANFKTSSSCPDVGVRPCNQAYRPEEVLVHTIIPPIIEEPIYRAVPAYVLNKFEKNETPLRDVMTGAGGLGMTRREALVGVVTAGLFALSHNVTAYGVDTRPIPVSQFLLGCETWYLQRKGGLPGAVVAHGVNNYKFMQK